MHVSQDASNGPVKAAAAAAAEDEAETRASGSSPHDTRLDEFEAAARLFSFTGETSVKAAPSTREGQRAARAAASTPSSKPHVARRRGLAFKRVAAACFSLGVFGVVGLLAVGLTTPVGAVAAANGADPAHLSLNALADSSQSNLDDDRIQAYVAPADVDSGAVERNDSYQALSLAEIAAESGIHNFSNFFTNNPSAAIQWPFSVGVPISYGFGVRSGRLHEGVDFTPGEGSPVQAIADGTVRIATESGGAYGVTVVIDHIIDGELVSSRYGHMQYGSLKVKPGEKITVGTVIGKVGNTGRSFGAHMHFEILPGGTTAIDPLPWLREHAGG